MSRALIADPAHEGVQLLATDGGRDVGFATLFWSWETTTAGRIGVMNDLFVVAGSRGRGVASALISACLERCREHGAVRMTWQTAVDNVPAQAVYDHIGATREAGSTTGSILVSHRPRNPGRSKPEPRRYYFLAAW